MKRQPVRRIDRSAGEMKRALETIFDGPRWLTAPEGFALAGEPVEVHYYVFWEGPDSVVTAECEPYCGGTVTRSAETLSGEDAHAALVELLLENDRSWSPRVFSRMRPPPARPLILHPELIRELERRFPEDIQEMKASGKIVAAERFPEAP